MYPGTLAGPQPADLMFCVMSNARWKVRSIRSFLQAVAIRVVAAKSILPSLSKMPTTTPCTCASTRCRISCLIVCKQVREAQGGEGGKGARSICQMYLMHPCGKGASGTSSSMLAIKLSNKKHQAEASSKATPEDVWPGASGLHCCLT